MSRIRPHPTRNRPSGLRSCKIGKAGRRAFALLLLFGELHAPFLAREEVFPSRLEGSDMGRNRGGGQEWRV